MAQKERTKRAFGDMIMGRWYAESWKCLNFNCFKMFAFRGQDVIRASKQFQHFAKRCDFLVYQSAFL